MLQLQNQSESNDANYTAQEELKTYWFHMSFPF
jgi:hypothetical protein